MILRTVHRSRFAEPRESVSVFAYPQRRSFGACSGFQIDTCPIRTRRCSYCLTVTEVGSGTKLHITVSRRSTTKEPQAARFREAGPTIRNPLQAAKQRSCGYERQPLPTTVPRSGTDISTMVLRTIHRSRFAEPRESENVCLPTAALLRSLQWVSDRYVSHQDTALLILSYSNGGRQWYKVTYYSQPPKHH